MKEQPNFSNLAATGEIIDINTSQKLNPELSAFLAGSILSSDGAQSVITSITSRAQAMSAEGLQNIGQDQFDTTIMSLEDRLLLGDIQGQYAKYGYAPLNTVEGLIKLGDLLSDLYKINELLPLETKKKAAELSRDLAVLEANRDLVIRTENLTAQLAYGNLNTEVTVSKILNAPVIEEARVSAKEKTVTLRSRSKTAEIDNSVLKGEKRAELIRKRIHAIEAQRRAVIDEAVRPIVKFFIKWGLIIGVLLVIVANLVANQPAYSHAFILGSVNHWWHSIYMPIRGGIVQIYNKYHH